MTHKSYSFSRIWQLFTKLQLFFNMFFQIFPCNLYCFFWIFTCTFNIKICKDSKIGIPNFMFPRVYGPESFEVLNYGPDEVYETYAHSAYGEPIANPGAGEGPRDVDVYLSPSRKIGEVLDASYPGGNATYFTDLSPVLAQPAADVYLYGYGYLDSVDYNIELTEGRIDITNGALPSGILEIDYSVAGSDEPAAFILTGAANESPFGSYSTARAPWVRAFREDGL